MDELLLDAPLSRRRFNTSLLTGLAGLGTLAALPAGAADLLDSEFRAALAAGVDNAAVAAATLTTATGTATTAGSTSTGAATSGSTTTAPTTGTTTTPGTGCTVTAAQMMAAVLGTGGKLLRQYVDPLYSGYSRPVYVSGYGTVYVRHTGRDFGKPIGAVCRALAPGRVTGIMNPNSPPRWQAAVVYDGGDTYWIYGHLNLAVRVGQVINRGQIVGKIADPAGQFPPHIHVGAYKVAMPTTNKATKAAVSWGRAYGKTAAQAQSNATLYSYDPLLAYARTLGKAC
jgi:murein DD-endopeptidase MepM/ murein hydrolase activator NlpD